MYIWRRLHHITKRGLIGCCILRLVGGEVFGSANLCHTIDVVVHVVDIVENDQIQAWVKLLRYIVVKWRHTHYPPERKFFLVYSLLFNLVHTTDENFIELGNGVLYYVLVLLLWVYLLNYWEDNLTNIFTGNTKNVRIFCLRIWNNQVMLIYSKVSISTIRINFNAFHNPYYFNICQYSLFQLL